MHNCALTLNRVHLPVRLVIPFIDSLSIGSAMVHEYTLKHVDTYNCEMDPCRINHAGAEAEVFRKVSVNIMAANIFVSSVLSSQHGIGYVG